MVHGILSPAVFREKSVVTKQVEWVQDSWELVGQL